MEAQRSWTHQKQVAGDDPTPPPLKKKGIRVALPLTAKP
ncbi:hypothetical protein ACP70R_045249 [Stipagrostis hirtigluma subsp. patula]